MTESSFSRSEYDPYGYGGFAPSAPMAMSAMMAPPGAFMAAAPMMMSEKMAAPRARMAAPMMMSEDYGCEELMMERGAMLDEISEVAMNV